MDLPVKLNVSLGNAGSQESGLAPQGGGGFGGESFSEHLDGKLSRLKGERSGDSVVLNTKEAGAAGKTEELDEGLIAEGVEKEVSDSDEGINVLPISGNELPNMGNIEASFNMQAKQIVFDPLGKAQEIPGKMAIEVGDELLMDRLKFNSKTGDLFFEVGSSTSLAMDKGIFDNMAKAVMNSSLTGELAQQLNGKSVTVSADLLPTNSAQGMLTTNVQSPLQPVATERPTLQLDTPVGTSRWGQDFNQRIQWVVNQSMSGAQIRLNPQNMGPVEVRVQMQNDQLSLSFTAQHGATREAIEAALPKLREMLSEQNINRTDVGISQHSFSEQRERQAAGEEAGGLPLSSEKPGEGEDSLFDDTENEQRILYTGLFNGFA